jgi:hypothetical protein
VRARRGNGKKMEGEMERKKIKIVKKIKIKKGKKVNNVEQ